MPDPNELAAACERIGRAMETGHYVGEPGQREREWQLLAEYYLTHRQQVAALAAATFCGTVAFRGDDGSGESIVAIRFDCRTEADEFVKLLESLGVNP
jgi:hypothetical protein